MNILGYGEDALTLWALTERTAKILSELKDTNSPSACTLLFRPSFGRSGGPKNSEFGEFDFILASPTCVYLGESKWDRSPEVAESAIRLRREQTERHRVFAAYYRIWVTRSEWEWADFLAACAKDFAERGMTKPVPPAESLLSQNLRKTLSVVAETTGRKSSIRDVLLVVDSRGIVDAGTKTPPAGFALVVVNAASNMTGNFVPIGQGR